MATIDTSDYKLSINDLTESDCIIILNTYILTKDKRKTCKLTKISQNVLNDVLSKYYFIIQDIMYDINISDKYKDKYSEMIDIAFETSSKILKIYNAQVDNIYNLYEQEPTKLIKDYLMRQLQLINSDLFNIIKVQLELCESHKSGVYVGCKQTKIDQSLDKARCNSDEYMENRQTILDEIMKNCETWHYRNETTGEEFECDTKEDMIKIANLKSGPHFENGTCSRAIEANDKTKLWTKDKNIRIWSE